MDHKLGDKVLKDQFRFDAVTDASEVVQNLFVVAVRGLFEELDGGPYVEAVVVEHVVEGEQRYALEEEHAPLHEVLAEVLFDEPHEKSQHFCVNGCVFESFAGVKVFDFGDEAVEGGEDELDAGKL